MQETFRSYGASTEKRLMRTTNISTLTGLLLISFLEINEARTYTAIGFSIKPTT